MEKERKAEDRDQQRLPLWLRRELGPLANRYDVRWDADDRAVSLDEVELPEEFSPRVIPVTLKLPSTFPQAAPRVEVPWELRYHNRVPRHLLTSGQWLVRGGRLGDPMVFFPEDWNQGDSLKTVVDAVLDDLARISEADPGTVPDN